MTSIEDFKYPGEHQFEGAAYHFGHSPDVLPEIKEELKLDTSDVVIATYPKSGTTWMQEMVYSVVEGPDVKRTQAIDDIYYFIEMSKRVEDTHQTSYSLCMSSPPPRLLKTHLQVSFYERLLQHQETCPKFVIVLRNPKDTLVSFYRFHRMLIPFKFEFCWDDFFENFKKKKLLYGDVINFCTGWWKYRNHPKVLLLTYEEMLADTTQVISRVADFIDHPISETDAKRICENASFDEMKARGLASYMTSAAAFNQEQFQFFGHGRSGSWRDYFSTDQSDYVDEVVRKECEPLGLNFTYV